MEVLSVRPEFVEIISWNDYGEPHYIGPLHEGRYELFRTGKAPFNYAENMPHDGWQTALPFIIAPGAARGSGGIWANTQSHA
ncbi:hypothetical protein CNMCM5878_006701 [Aspergillus fumigatiaffinis]|nr:hypothetical protein CNMCM6457_003698 [Aspergillus fumigatiaffinis]KAF4222106.1 hypothetical protein CNMCM5878_006701 [Aspergillus fumigatiaffinis]